MFWKKQADVVMEDERSLESVQEIEEMTDVRNHYIMKENGMGVGELRMVEPGLERPKDY